MAALRIVLTDREIRVDPKGLAIRAARFLELIDLDNVNFPHRLCFSYCAFEQALNADSAQLRRLELDHVHASGEVRALGATIDGDLSFSNSTLMQHDNEKDGRALNLDGVTVNGDLSADDLHAFGEVRAIGATIHGQLSFRKARLENEAGRALSPKGVKVGCGLFADEGSHASGEVSALDATIDGQMRFRGAIFENADGCALNLDRVTVSGGLFADDLRATGEIRALGATAKGDLSLNNATLMSPRSKALSLDGATVSGGLFAETGFHARGEFRAVGATVGNKLTFNGADLKNAGGYALNLASAKVDQLVLSPASFAGQIDLTRIQVTALETTSSPPSPLVATGWKIADLHEGLRDDWKLVHAWLSSARATESRSKRQPVPVQPWHGLAEVYDRNGDPAGARRLRLKAAKQVTRQSPLATRFVRHVYFLAAGHGYYPLFAVFWLLAILAAGVILVAVNREDIAPTNSAAATTAVQRHFGIDVGTPGPDLAAKQKQADAFLPLTAEMPCEIHPNNPCMNSPAFAIKAVLPPAASTNRDWDTNCDATPALVVGLPILKLLSWAFAALLLAGVTGLLRKT